MKIIVEFIPVVILVLLFMCFSKTLITLSQTILGKLFSVILIIFYTRFDKYIGLLICSIVILYYQKIDTLTENMEMSDGIDQAETDDSQERLDQKNALKFEKSKEDNKQEIAIGQMEIEKLKLENDKERSLLDAKRLATQDRCERAELMSKDKNATKEMLKKANDIRFKCMDDDSDKKREKFTVQKLNSKLGVETLLMPKNTRNM